MGSESIAELNKAFMMLKFPIEAGDKLAPVV
jgi:hypothetical protein